MNCAEGTDHQSIRTGRIERMARIYLNVLCYGGRSTCDEICHRTTRARARNTDEAPTRRARYAGAVDMAHVGPTPPGNLKMKLCSNTQHSQHLGCRLAVTVVVVVVVGGWFPSTKAPLSKMEKKTPQPPLTLHHHPRLAAAGQLLLDPADSPVDSLSHLVGHLLGVVPGHARQARLEEVAVGRHDAVDVERCACVLFFCCRGLGFSDAGDAC